MSDGHGVAAVFREWFDAQPMTALKARSARKLRRLAQSTQNLSFGVEHVLGAVEARSAGKHQIQLPKVLRESIFSGD
jgi:hypothetical protein